MVATRSGVRAFSPNGGETQECSADMEATPTARRTRRSTVQGGAQLHSDATNEHQHDEGGSSTLMEARSSTVKRKTRSSTRQEENAAQPDSTHEADVSESESCCSAASESRSRPHTRSGRRHISPRRKANARKEEDEMSEAESCCSSASATRRTSVQRNTRSQRKRLPADDQPEQQGDGSERSEAELGSSVILRASRTRTGAALKSLEEDTEPSEPDSCSSSISSLRNTAVRRVTRARSARAISPIPMELEADSHASSRPLQTRAGRAKPASASKSQPYDSEGFESGPSNTPRRSARLCRSATQQTQLAVLSDSESGSTDVYSPLGSPCSLRAKSTPCSSRTGSANSSRALLLPQATTKAQVPMDTLSQSAQLTISNAVDVLGQEGVLGADSPLDSECKLTEELEPDNTLTAECEEMVEVQEASPNQTAIVTIFESASTNKHDGDEEQGDTMDTSVVPESPQIEVSQKSEGNTSVNEETDLAEEVSAGEMVSNCSVRVSFSNCAPVEDDNVEGKDLTGQETQEDDVDKTVIEESVEDGVGMAVRDEAEEPEKLGQKPGLFFLLESSEEEGESDDGGQSAEEQESEGSDREDNTQLDGTEAGPSHPRPEEPVPIDELFVVDTQPGLRPNEKYYLDEEQKRVESSDAEDKSEEEFIDQEVDDDEEDDDDEDDEDAKLLFKSKKPVMELSSSIDPGLKVKEMGGLYITFDGTRSKAASDTLKKLKEQKNIDELLKKSIIGPDFERKDSVPPYKESKKALKLKRREEREKTTGDGWFNMKAPEMTQELKNDLQALKMRSAVDPKRFYKKNDREGFPKYLQVGTVVECPLDFYHSRIPKKQRKRTIVEELLADAEFRNYNKKKYKEIIAEKAALAAGRKNRKKQKFSKKEK